MGGLGSGRRSGYDGKPETQNAWPLDIRQLSRSGLLVPGNSFVWQWRTVNEAKKAGISLRVEPHALVLSYRKGSTGEVVEQRVQLETTLCRLGGQRCWFTCPRCRKRVAILYERGKAFACRQCCGLGYASQKEGVGDRSTRQANRIRKQLGWPPGILNEAGGKPKGMHWQTYRRLKAEHDSCVQVSFQDIGRKLGILDRLVQR